MPQFEQGLLKILSFGLDSEGNPVSSGAGISNAVNTASGSVPNYDGSIFSLGTFKASTPYRVAALEFDLTGGTSGNTADLFLGESSTFVPGRFGTRIPFGTQMVDDNDNEVEVYVEGVPVTTDDAGKLWVSGSTTGADDSTLSARIDLYEDTSA